MTDEERLERLGPWIRGETDEITREDLDWIWEHPQYLTIRPLED